MDQLFGESSVVRGTLDNGLVYLHEPAMASGLLTVQVWFRTGSIHEAELLGSGVSHFLEHLLFKGSARRGPLAFAREVQALGGSMNAYTTFDRTVYYVEGPAADADALMDIVADLAFGATLPESEFARERDVILREIAMGDDEPDRLLFRHFAETAFQRHPYRFPVIGYRELFSSLTPADVRHYYETRCAPNNAVVVLAGALSPERATELVEKYFGGLPARRVTPVVIEAEPPQLGPRRRRREGDYDIERGLLGLKIPGLAHADAPALEVLAGILAQGQSSHLWQRLRDGRGVVQSIEGGCWNPGAAGLFFVGYTADPEDQASAEAAIWEELMKTHDHLPTPGEVAKVIQKTVVSDVNAGKTVSGLASRLGTAEVVVGEVDYHRRRLARLREVTPEAVQAVARRYLRPDGLTVASLGPTAPASRRAAASVADTVAFQREVRPNGAQLLWQPGGPLPKIHLRLLWLGGPLLETPGLRGATGILATLLTRDTATATAEVVAERVEALGGSLHEVCGNNSFGLAVEFLSEHTAEALLNLKEAVHEAQLTESRFEREREAQISSLREENDDALDWARRLHRARCFGDHPHAHDFLGTEEDLEGLSWDTVRQLRDRLMVAPRAVLAVSGQFDAATVLPVLRDLLDRLPSAPAGYPGFPSPLTALAETGRAVVQRDCEQAIVILGFRDGGILSPDYFASELLDELLSGMASRLFMRVREEQGLAYYVTATRTVGLHSGLFTIYAGTAPDKVPQVEAAIQEELNRLMAGQLDDGELAAARKRLQVRKLTSRQSPGGRAMEAAIDALYGRPASIGEDYPALLASVTPEMLTAHAQRLFAPTNCFQLTVLPED